MYTLRIHVLNGTPVKRRGHQNFDCRIKINNFKGTRTPFSVWCRDNTIPVWDYFRGPGRWAPGSSYISQTREKHIAAGRRTYYLNNFHNLWPVLWSVESRISRWDKCAGRKLFSKRKSFNLQPTLPGAQGSVKWKVPYAWSICDIWYERTADSRYKQSERVGRQKCANAVIVIAVEGNKTEINIFIECKIY